MSKQPWYRTPKALSALAFLILITLIWFLGPYVGMKRLEVRFGWIFGLMVLWVVILLVGQLLAQRSGMLFERMLRRNADEAVLSASPDRRSEVQLLRKRLLGAIDTLQQSKIGKHRGRAALYELPWYMVIGHPGAGKSTAILQSGLTFPLAGKGTVSVSGIGGTRNCDWFFSTEGVLLDTAGRYAVQTEDRQEWIEFLHLLKRYRAKAPVNGVLVTLSCSELLEHRGEGFAAYLRQVRQRLHELEEVFKARVPVYLLFTKMDLIPGFSAFFANLNEEQRHHPWGASLAHEQPEGFDAAGLAMRHMDQLADGLQEMAQERLEHSDDPEVRAAMIGFPMSFRNLKESVFRFVEHLVQKDPYHAQPLIRGLYFTSALQTSNAQQSLGVRLASTFRMDRQGIAMRPPAQPRSYFLKGLFDAVVFPDQYLVSRQVRPSVNRNRLMAIGSGLTGMLALVGIWTWSFLGNQALLADAGLEASVSRRLATAPDVLDRLKALQILQLRIEQLESYRREHPPLGLRWGLYQGEGLETALRAEYWKQVQPLMLEPVKKALELRLETELADGKAVGSKEAEELYNALKAYLMLSDRPRMESAHLSDQLPRYWRSWLEQERLDPGRPDVQRMVERTVRFYASQGGAEDLPLVKPNAALIASSRARLQGVIQVLSPLERVYAEIKSRANTQFPAMTVGRALDNRDLDIVAGSHAIPGAFTREAYEKFLQKSFQQAANGELAGTDWVLAAPMDAGLQRAEAKENLQKLEALYKTEFIQEWDRFIKGVAILEYKSIEHAAGTLGRLADPRQSPFKALLRRTAQETNWDNPNALSKTIADVKTSVVKKTEALLGTQQPELASSPVWGEVGGRFQGLATLVAGSPDGRCPLDGYLDQLRKVQTRLGTVAGAGEGGGAARQLLQSTLGGAGSELAEALQYIDNVLVVAMDPGSREMARALLSRPLMQGTGALTPEVEKDLNRLWTQQVWRPWQALVDKYPFTDASNDALLGDIAKFMRPNDGPLAQFIEKSLGTMVVRKNGQLVPRNVPGAPPVRFNPAFLQGANRMLQVAEQAMAEGENCRFEIQPVATPGIQETVLEIDGQKLSYRNGPQSWTAFQWPGTSGGSARVSVVSNVGAAAQVCQVTGRLSLLRMLDHAERVSWNGSTGQFEFRFKVPKSFSNRGAKEAQEEPYAHAVRFNIRLVSGLNPLRLRELRRLSLPARVTL